MTIADIPDLFTLFDALALGLLISTWLLIGWRIETQRFAAKSVSLIMADFRRAWMRQMITRQPRIFDAQTIATLRQGTSFFASTSMIALGGTLALIGNADSLINVASDLTLISHPVIVWEIKLLLIALFLINAFLKFVWSNRLFGYCSVIMAAVPNEPDHPEAEGIARKAAEVNITATRSFNRGLRSVYYALASVAWLGGGTALMVAAIFTTLVIWRREFASHSRAILLE